MREIKFRAWDEMSDTMFDVSRIDFTTSGTHWIFDESERMFQSDEAIHLMQFTGLKDKNGKEIYEGDVFHTNAVVEWKDAWWRVRSINANSTFTHDLAGYVEGIRPTVIGNIYENPELLK